MKDLNLFKTKDSIFLKKISSKKELVKNENVDGYLIASSESEARRIIESLKGTKKIIAFVGGDSLLNRRAIETLKINYLVSPEEGEKKDSLKQRDSGLNHVLAKAAVKKGISIVFDMSRIKNLSKEALSSALGRLMQNVIICRKANCNIKIASLSKEKKSLVSEIGRKSFGVSLGMSSKQSRDSVIF